MNVSATMTCVQSDSKETTLSLANNEHSYCFFFPRPSLVWQPDSC